MKDHFSYSYAKYSKEAPGGKICGLTLHTSPALPAKINTQLYLGRDTDLFESPVHTVHRYPGNAHTILYGFIHILTV